MLLQRSKKPRPLKSGVQTESCERSIGALVAQSDGGVVLDIDELLSAWSDDLGAVEQNHHLDEGALISFVKEHGIPITGVVTGDPGKFNELGWLPHDGTRTDGAPLYHPFRFYTIHRVLNACRIPIAASASLDREGVGAFVDRIAREWMPELERIGEWTASWNRVVALSILLEPIYWPKIIGLTVRSAFLYEHDFQVALDAYSVRLERLVAELDPEEWRKIHKDLRVQAAIVDDNSDLYLLLRTSKWDRRKRLKGDVSCALWVRHMAEMIRKAFEDIHGVEWPEEDCALGWWPPGARKNTYGSPRPLDDVLEARPRLAAHYGLATGSSVRWYVEGDTEYYAVLAMIPEPSKVGIELVNLRGNIASERANIALKLTDGLENDCAHRRFSILSFDLDVAENAKVIRRQIENDRIVGYIAAHDPDFEFANFTLDELVEVAARMDESLGFPGSAIRNADWNGIGRAKDFEQQYQEISERRGARLKGADWGRCLAEYAGEHPYWQDSDKERPLWGEIRAALQGRTANYDRQRERFRFDPHTFELMELAD